ncbi:MAG: 3-oxoacyl-[acyl-carrier protein] reductase, partial [Kiritimatiellia bacterium]
MSHLPDLSLNGRHALVCGASAGIGRATALTLAAMGAHVTVLARRSDRLATLVSEIEAAGGTAGALIADLDERSGLGERIDALIEERGPVHILINNSGGPPGGPLLKAGEEELLTAMGRHLFASHLMVQRCVPG